MDIVDFQPRGLRKLNTCKINKNNNDVKVEMNLFVSYKIDEIIFILTYQHLYWFIHIYMSSTITQEVNWHFHYIVKKYSKHEQ